MVLLSKIADTADSVVSFTPRYNSSRTVFIPLIRAVASEGAAQYIHEYYSQDYGIVMYMHSSNAAHMFDAHIYYMLQALHCVMCCTV